MFRYFLVGLLFSVAAHAHEPFEITTSAHVNPDRITLSLLITDSTAAKLCLPNATSASRLHEAELAAAQAQVEQCARELFIVKDGASKLVPNAVQVRLTEENDLDVQLTYPPANTNKVSFDAVHLARLADPVYGDAFTAAEGGRFIVQKLLQAEDPLVEIVLDAKSAPVQASFGDFLHLGIEHILTGYDHLLFLVGLLIVCRRLHTALIIITAFTLAHSITLALAALNIVTIPSSIVEPLIAATIVFVGIENLWGQYCGREPKGRWLLTFCFGLLHGFGFASALQAIGLPSGGAGLIVPLLAFNLGVELGQLAVAVLLLPLLFWLLRFSFFIRRVVPTVSLLVVLAGLYWLLQRTIL